MTATSTALEDLHMSLQFEGGPRALLHAALLRPGEYALSGRGGRKSPRPPSTSDRPVWAHRRSRLAGSPRTAGGRSAGRGSREVLDDAAPRPQRQARPRSRSLGYRTMHQSSKIGTAVRGFGPSPARFPARLRNRVLQRRPCSIVLPGGDGSFDLGTLNVPATLAVNRRPGGCRCLRRRAAALPHDSASTSPVRFLVNRPPVRAEAAHLHHHFDRRAPGNVLG